MAKQDCAAETREPPQQAGMEEEAQAQAVTAPKAQRGEAGGKLGGKVALVTGGDNGVGRAVAVALAKEGADIALVYHHDAQEAQEAARLIEQERRKCLLLALDVGQEELCELAVQEVIDTFGRLDILVNNAFEGHRQTHLGDITDKQLQRTFRINIFSMFYLCKAAVVHMKEGGVIINTASVAAYRGSATLLDYAAAAGAVVAFTRSLALNLAGRKIRVNAVALGPIWRATVPATLEEEEVEALGQKVPMGRAGEPEEVAACYVFLACADSSYMSGQVLHVNGGEVING